MAMSGKLTKEREKNKSQFLRDRFYLFRVSNAIKLGLMSLLSFFSCSDELSMEQKIANLNQYLDTQKTTSAYQELEVAIKEKINYWEAKQVPIIQAFNKHQGVSNNLIIPNKDGDKALFLVSFIRDKDGFFNLHAAELKEGKWHFFQKGLPNFTYDYKEDKRNGQPFSIEELTALTKIKLIKDGLVDKQGEVNQAYINERWLKPNRKPAYFDKMKEE